MKKERGFDMRKKILSVLIAGALTAGVLPATVFAEDAKPYDGVTLSVFVQTATDYNDGMKAIMEKATEELGMEFAVEVSPGGTEGDNVVKTRCVSGDLPDILNYNCGSLFLALNPKEHFLDITDEEVASIAIQ